MPPPSASPGSMLSFCVLASGSAGNCTAVFLREPAPSGEEPRRRLFLIDVGISPRRTAASLADMGAGIDDVEAIVLTHFDTDHFYPGWLKVIARRNAGDRPMRVCVHRRHRNVAWRSGLTARETELYEDELGLPCGATAEPVLLAHDDVGSVGFVIEHEGHRLGYATDLGAVPKTLLDRFVNLHALCIESNYDRRMQEESARPIFLKRRIMDGRGHLSNEQALEAAREIERRSALGHIALLHLSRECNCPRKVRSLWQRAMPHALPRLTITSQTAPTPLLGVTRADAGGAGGAGGAIVEVKQGLLFEVART